MIRRNSFAPKAALAAGELRRKNLTVRGVLLPNSLHEARRRALADITRWISTGDRILAVAGTYPLHEIASAHEAVERGDKAGTVVVGI